MEGGKMKPINQKFSHSLKKTSLISVVACLESSLTKFLDFGRRVDLVCNTKSENEMGESSKPRELEELFLREPWICPVYCYLPITP